MQRTPKKIYHSCKESKVIFVDLFNHHADHLDILWCWLMHRHAGHMSCYCPQGTLHLLNS
ncbi:hypothetical protein RchiOBHm_Chr1g0323061 [Rosa chinensis]|uniref:Uncharacterized protein n=1 Tax=Rosa chinensis TaxID=74649 RepID=A0A2P6S9C9_ROSCH|nr:hypothetical protein RchiOBHm_Chr1g0323061 [Rosa chinensis]